MQRPPLCFSVLLLGGEFALLSPLHGLVGVGVILEIDKARRRKSLLLPGKDLTSYLHTE